MNKAAINNLNMFVLGLCTHLSSICTLGRNAGSQCGHMVSLHKYCQIVSQRDCSSGHSPPAVQECNPFYILTTIWYCQPVKFSHSAEGLAIYS